MVAPHGRVRAMVPVTLEVAQSSQISGLPMLALEEVGQVGRPFLPAGSGRGWVGQSTSFKYRAINFVCVYKTKILFLGMSVCGSKLQVGVLGHFSCQ